MVGTSVKEKRRSDPYLWVKGRACFRLEFGLESGFGFRLVLWHVKRAYLPVRGRIRVRVRVRARVRVRSWFRLG